MKFDEFYKKQKKYINNESLLHRFRNHFGISQGSYFLDTKYEKEIIRIRL